MTRPEPIARLRAAALAIASAAPIHDRLLAAHRFLPEGGADAVTPELLVRLDELRADFEYGAPTLGEALARMSTADLERLGERVIALYAAFAASCGHSD